MCGSMVFQNAQVYDPRFLMTASLKYTIRSLQLSPVKSVPKGKHMVARTQFFAARRLFKTHLLGKRNPNFGDLQLSPVNPILQCEHAVVSDNTIVLANNFQDYKI